MGLNFKLTNIIFYFYNFQKGVTFPKLKGLAKVTILDGIMTGKEKLVPSSFTAAALETQTDLKLEKSVMNYVELRNILVLHNLGLLFDIKL